MYSLNERIKVRLKFIKYGEYGEKIYKDFLGTTFIWCSKSNLIEDGSWFTVSTKLYEGLDEHGNLSYLRLFNPRIVK